MNEYLADYPELIRWLMEADDKKSTVNIVKALFRDLRDEINDLNSGVNESLICSSLEICTNKVNRRLILIDEYIKAYEKENLL